jgi:hypothetical protein
VRVQERLVHLRHRLDQAALPHAAGRVLAEQQYSAFGISVNFTVTSGLAALNGLMTWSSTKASP